MTGYKNKAAGPWVSTERYSNMTSIVGVSRVGNMMNTVRDRKAKAKAKVNYGKVVLGICVCVCVWYGMHMDSVDLAIGALK